MVRKKKPASVTENEWFPRRLREIMNSKGIIEGKHKTSQEELGNAIGVQRQTISLYTTGQSKPDVDGITEIARAFDVSADWLLGLVKDRTTEVDIKITCKTSCLSENTIKSLQNIQLMRLDIFTMLDHLLNDVGLISALAHIKTAIAYRKTVEFLDDYGTILDELKGLQHESDAPLGRVSIPANMASRVFQRQAEDGMRDVIARIIDREVNDSENHANETEYINGLIKQGGVVGEWAKDSLKRIKKP